MLERVWILLGLAWAVFRVVVAKATVEKYGVNIAAFAVLEIAVAWPHALGSARVVTKLIDRNPNGALPWGLLLAVTHVAPELYIAVVGSHMPFGVYVSLGAVVVGLGALAVIGITQKVVAGRTRPVGWVRSTAAARGRFDSNGPAALGDAALARVSLESSDPIEEPRRVDQVRVVPLVGPNFNGRRRYEAGEPWRVVGSGIDAVNGEVRDGDGRRELADGYVELLGR
jgi:hypothetical protein